MGQQAIRRLTSPDSRLNVNRSKRVQKAETGTLLALDRMECSLERASDCGKLPPLANGSGLSLYGPSAAARWLNRRMPPVLMTKAAAGSAPRWLRYSATAVSSPEGPNRTEGGSWDMALSCCRDARVAISPSAAKLNRWRRAGRGSCWRLDARAATLPCAAISDFRSNPNQNLLGNEHSALIFARNKIIWLAALNAL